MTLTTDREEFEQWAELACELPWGFLAKRRKDSGEYADSTYEDMWKAWVAGREALANRETLPVLYASEETLAYAKEGEKSLVTWSEPMGDAVIPLFTIPKAQTSGVVNLPTEFISDEGVMVRLEQVMAALALVGVKYERRGDACRAAMLAAARDGWKLVPVEPTEEMLRAAYRESGVYSAKAYRAMLAAAPEGGNGA